MNDNRILFWSLILILGLASCQSEELEPVPDVSDIEVDLQIRRFERDLFNLDTNDFENQLAKLEENYPDFSEIYFDNILGSRDERIAPRGHAAYVKGFIRHPPVRFLYDTTQIMYGDLGAIRSGFRKAFQFFKYYFPDQPVPTLTTFISEYTVAAFVYEGNRLATGLDFFLGADFPYRRYNPGNPNFSEYLTRTFNQDHLVSKTMQALVNDLVGPPAGNRMLDLMIHNGKKLYLLDHLLPFEPDSVILEVSQPQVEWLFDNELELWAYFLQEDLLYSSTWQDIRKFVEYSPHSPGMPPEAPGRTANFSGWQVVRAYMKRHPETTMQELIEIKDAQQLLDQSRYKPRR